MIKGKVTCRNLRVAVADGVGNADSNMDACNDINKHRSEVRQTAYPVKENVPDESIIVTPILHGDGPATEEVFLWLVLIQVDQG